MGRGAGRVSAANWGIAGGGGGGLNIFFGAEMSIKHHMFYASIVQKCCDCSQALQKLVTMQILWNERSVLQGSRIDPLTPILLKSIAIHLPFLSRYFCKSTPSSWQTVVYTPPSCITICLPVVFRGSFCESREGVRLPRKRG